MQWIKNTFRFINRNYADFCFGIADIICGLYTLLHANYLDTARVTPPPPDPSIIYETYGYSDDWWFALVILAAGLLILLGTCFRKNLIRKIGMSGSMFIYCTLAFSFASRGLFTNRINVTWIFMFLVFFLIMHQIGKGDGR